MYEVVMWIAVLLAATLAVIAVWRLGGGIGRRLRIGSHESSLLKSVVWRIMGVLVLGSVTFFFTRHWVITTAITLVHHATFVIVFYLHERAWMRYPTLKGKLRNVAKAFTYEIILGMGIYAAIYGGFAFAREALHVWVLFVVYGIYYGLTEGALRAHVADLVPSNLRATAFGIFHAAVGLTAFPASLLMGLLWQTLGVTMAFALGATLALVAAIVLMVGTR